MRRVHLFVGALGVIAFLLTGQVMKHHHPAMVELPAEVRMMYLSRHIYLLGASLVNVALGLYLQMHPWGWRRVLQGIGSLLIVLAPVSLLMAFLTEPGLAHIIRECCLAANFLSLRKDARRDKNLVERKD